MGATVRPKNRYSLLACTRPNETWYSETPHIIGDVQQCPPMSLSEFLYSLDLEQLAGVKGGADQGLTLDRRADGSDAQSASHRSLAKPRPSFWDQLLPWPGLA
ncbi:hypothetical protein PoB_007034600 [Plakobranchus ocellatus]|uniref:Uncharacterized protein n=1 Tax=Plakobranchus ocellatus TaxID=259542 RepID=A0AAV4DI67_9GAST|nr:hypothetical protein PoB_007034600 [Plakobranchus ocellatus]